MSAEQILGLYNYWVVIFLMMTGFYIVIARNNLIKTVIGLNIFQISVILLYVSIGKVSGGTAPIVPPALVSHGHSHAESHDHGDHGHGDHHGPEHKKADHEETSDHDHDHDSHATKNHEDDHDADHDSHADEADGDHGDSHGSGHEHSKTSDAHSSDATAKQPTDLVYSNPLPSVLMLTAIVVGVATTALALALIVRIREDYGTIEEDEILELDRAT